MSDFELTSDFRRDAIYRYRVSPELCLNAREAMPEGGKLRLSARNIFINETYVRLNQDARVGSYIVITVEDTEGGIAPEIATRIFDPFFTTKQFNEGTGLGLAIAANIIKNHDGFIDISSTILMDMMMPSLDGNSAIAELKKIDPQVKILVTSGLDLSNNGIGTFLRKPYTAEELTMIRATEASPIPVPKNSVLS